MKSLTAHLRLCYGPKVCFLGLALSDIVLLSLVCMVTRGLISTLEVTFIQSQPWISCGLVFNFLMDSMQSSWKVFLEEFQIVASIPGLALSFQWFKGS